MDRPPPGLTVAVLGAARSGVSAANLLARHGCRVLLSDLSPTPGPYVERLDPAVELTLGANELGDAELVVASPGVPPHAPILLQATKRGLPIWSEPELAYRFCPAPIVAITGTDGKSTVTTMIAHLLEATGHRMWVGGNLGVPFCEGLLDNEIPDDGYAVVEISCFHLLHMKSFRPRVALLLNIAEDHLDVHGSIAEYVAAKQRIFENLGEGDTAIYWAGDPRCATPAHAAKARGAQVQAYDLGDLPSAPFSSADIPLLGTHNRLNALAAFRALEALDVPLEGLPEALRGYRGLPHRLEIVRETNGVRWVNDSKATNPHAAAAGLASLESASIRLIAGGVDKGLSLDPLVAACEGRVVGAVTYGEIALRLAAALRGSVPDVVRLETLAEAVAHSGRNAKDGDTIVLAPACSSFDQFTSYGARGDAFRALVEEHANPK